MIEHGSQLRTARQSLGLTPNDLGRKLRLKGDQGARINEMENGLRPVSGPVAVAVEGMVELHRRVPPDLLRRLRWARDQVHHEYPVSHGAIVEAIAILEAWALERHDA